MYIKGAERQFCKGHNLNYFSFKRPSSKLSSQSMMRASIPSLIRLSSQEPMEDVSELDFRSKNDPERRQRQRRKAQKSNSELKFPSRCEGTRQEALRKRCNDAPTPLPTLRLSGKPIRVPSQNHLLRTMSVGSNKSNDSLPTIPRRKLSCPKLSALAA